MERSVTDVLYNAGLYIIRVRLCINHGNLAFFSDILRFFYTISLSITRIIYTRFAWAGGTCPRFAWAGRIFSPVILLCQFLVLAGNRFWFYILLFMYLGYRIVPYICSVVLVFLVLAGNSFWCYVRT